MPPPGSRQPQQAEVDTFITSLETARMAIPRVCCRSCGNSAHDANRIWNRCEGFARRGDRCRNVSATENEVNGFDNIAAALSISPSFLDQYVGAARLAAKLAVGEPIPIRASTRYPLPPGDQSAHIDGLPLGTRGGMKFRHNFPADGEYHFTVLDLAVGLYTRTVETRHTLVLLVDGREMFRKALGGPEDQSLVDKGGAPARANLMERFANIPVQVHAGVHDVVVTFIERPWNG